MLLFYLGLWDLRMKRMVKSKNERTTDYLLSIERSNYYYDKIKENSVEINMNFTQTRNFPEVLDWLRENVRNISFVKNRRYGTAW